eukprot:TRINITY_DN10593_c0_g1_i1.p1 TRINITY_DN10593_c0_g1~~TRINITY_DN10593_c0_g1_i1.p1  ORF type:complete len:150 (-),score=23.43 TRINITY_DN10593_c0_g1_i1:27-476(-)
MATVTQLPKDSKSASYLSICHSWTLLQFSKNFAIFLVLSIWTELNSVAKAQKLNCLPIIDLALYHLDPAINSTGDYSVDVKNEFNNQTATIYFNLCVHSKKSCTPDVASFANLYVGENTTAACYPLTSNHTLDGYTCLLYTSPSPRDQA